MSLELHFVPGGIYLRTPTGELIGRLDEPGAPFETLEEAREKLDWLQMVSRFQQTHDQKELIGVRRHTTARSVNAGRIWPA
ncbi:MAG TPA: hypothetical protein VMP01_20990 [Pirellulaceae bacterium]|nr:hypothetical protein [Pirellulaceae bacterium]